MGPIAPGSGEKEPADNDHEMAEHENGTSNNEQNGHNNGSNSGAQNGTGMNHEQRVEQQNGSQNAPERVKVGYTVKKMRPDLARRPRTPPPSPPPHADYIDSDYALARALQEEENRKARYIQHNYLSDPGTSNQRVHQYQWSRRYDYDDEEEEEEEEVEEEEEDRNEQKLIRACWKVYRQCQESVPDVNVPEPMSVPHVHPLNFLRGYHDVMKGDPFPELQPGFISGGPPVPPGSPGIADPISPSQIGKELENLGASVLSNVPSRRQASEDKPSAFDKFVTAANGQINRVSVPLFPRESSPDRYSPETNFAYPWEHEAFEEEEEMTHRRGPISMRKRQRMDEFELSEDSQPGPSNRRVKYNDHDDDFERENHSAPVYPQFDEDGREKPVFAVPTLPPRIAQKLAGHGLEKIETSPAAHRFRVTPVSNGIRTTYSSSVSNVEEENRYSRNSTHYSNFDGPSTSDYDPRESRRSRPVFSDELRNRHPFLRRTEDSDSLFNMDTFEEFEEPDISSTTTSMEPSESTWPCINWKDPEEMPTVDKISEKELRKMPPEYIELILNADVERKAREAQPPKPPSMFDKFQILADQEEKKEKEMNEGQYLQVCRSYVPSINKVPKEVFNTKFEVFIRFPFFERPLYVQNVLSALHIPDNKGNVLLEMPWQYKRMSVGEFFKHGVNIWMGLKLDNLPTHRALPLVEQEDAIERYLGSIMTRLLEDAALHEDIEDRKCAESVAVSQVDCIRRQDVNRQDLYEMAMYRRGFLNRQKEAAFAQRRLNGHEEYVEYHPSPILHVEREITVETEEGELEHSEEYEEENVEIDQAPGRAPGVNEHGEMAPNEQQMEQANGPLEVSVQDDNESENDVQL